MKAIILAAGEGRRLRPYTNHTPKCLLPINNKPLLGHWFDHCLAAGLDEVLVNGCYLADKVASYIDEITADYPFAIRFVRESRLLGTGGTLRNNYDFIRDEEFFLVCHGDNFTDIDLSRFIAFHRSRKAILSLALFHSRDPKSCGIVEEIDESGLISKFIEKPAMPASDLASAAIFLLAPQVVAALPKDREIDFSREVLPLYQGKMYGFSFAGFNIDIGTPESYEYANNLRTPDWRLTVNND